MRLANIQTYRNCILKILPYLGALSIFTTAAVATPVHNLVPPTVVYERGTNTQNFLLAQNFPINNQVLVGKWKGNRDAGIQFEIDFRSDGSYTYTVGADGVPWLTHIGEYQLRPSRVAGEWTNMILMLTPTELLRKPGSTEQSALEQRGLMDNSPHEYRVRFDPYYRKGEELYLLNVREHAQSTKSWSLYWQGQPRFRSTP